MPLRMGPPHGRVVFARGLSNHALEAAYSSAGLLPFPNLAEGFGWPIIKAQVCGYLPLLRVADDFHASCALGAQPVADILSMDEATRDDREARSRQCRGWAAHFQGDGAIDA